MFGVFFSKLLMDKAMYPSGLVQCILFTPILGAFVRRQAEEFRANSLIVLPGEKQGAFYRCKPFTL